MAATGYPVESRNTKDVRRIRTELSQRNCALTIEEVWAKEREAKRRLEAMGMRIIVKDPRAKPKDG